MGNWGSTSLGSPSFHGVCAQPAPAAVFIFVEAVSPSFVSLIFLLILLDCTFAEIAMSGANSRLQNLKGHFLPTKTGAPDSGLRHNVNRHTLSPTVFLPRAAAIEPEVGSPTERVCAGKVDCANRRRFETNRPLLSTTSQRTTRSSGGPTLRSRTARGDSHIILRSMATREWAS